MAKKKSLGRSRAKSRAAGPFIFISYRRADSSAAARWLYDSIQRTFGPERVFMDTEAIRVSAQWPKAIEQGLKRATHVISVIGSQWLRVTDDYGRRRIDRKDDWVRNEIAHALAERKHILPIVLSSGVMPRAEALPDSIQKLANVQPFELRSDRWEPDLNLLLGELEKQGFRRATANAVRYPTPQVHITEIPQKEFASLLRTLPGWTEVVSPLQGQEPLQQTELCKSFEFDSFRQAIEFMSEVSEFVVRTQHHPRWQNVWRNVTVWLSTWDIGHKPSQLDVELAREMELAYCKLKLVSAPKKKSGARPRHRS
jgi:pterin-4a-carbinolamine dehydratase